MKINPCRVAVLAFLSLIIASCVNAQTFTNLYDFTVPNGPNFTNTDGATPYDSLVVSGSRLYGTARIGGANDEGTVFAINIDGSSFTNLYSFTGVNSSGNPMAGLALSDDTLFGTAAASYNTNSGVVYSLKTDGSGYTNLHIFTPAASNGTVDTNKDGVYPNSPVTLSGTNLYGTTTSGGKFGYGTVFRVNTNGSGFTNLYNFTNGIDGANPSGSLLLSGGLLYGAASGGGKNGNGTLFTLNVSTRAFKVLYTFSYGAIIYNGVQYLITNFDGVRPNGALALAGKFLFGAAHSGGPTSLGTVFKVGTNGLNFSTLATNVVYQTGGVVVLEDTVYGADNTGIFSVKTNGADFSILYTFKDGADGAGPNGLALSGGAIYGTAVEGGNFGGSPFNEGYGTVFSFIISGGTQPKFNSVASIGNQLIQNGAGGQAGASYVVLTSTNLVLPLGNWTPVATNTFDASGNFTYTNIPAGSRAQQFYVIKVP